MKILVINGPNINMLGIREPEIYGNQNYKTLLDDIEKWSEEMGCQVECFQSNHEGAIVDKIQEAYGNFDGIVINPAAYTHTSVAIHDALEMFTGIKIEVHLSHVDEREDFRRINYVRDVCDKTFSGGLHMSYVDAVMYLKNKQ